MAEKKLACERCKLTPLPVSYIIEVYTGRMVRLCSGCNQALQKLVRDWLTKK